MPEVFDAIKKIYIYKKQKQKQKTRKLTDLNFMSFSTESAIAHKVVELILMPMLLSLHECGLHGFSSTAEYLQTSMHLRVVMGTRDS